MRYTCATVSETDNRRKFHGSKQRRRRYSGNPIDVRIPHGAATPLSIVATRKSENGDLKNAPRFSFFDSP